MSAGLDEVDFTSFAHIQWELPLRGVLEKRETSSSLVKFSARVEFELLERVVCTGFT